MCLVLQSSCLARSAKSLGLHVGNRPRHLSCSLLLRASLVEGVDEVACIEGPQRLDLLADADVAHRHAQLVADSQYDTAFGRAIELRQDDAGDLHRFLEGG